MGLVGVMNLRFVVRLSGAVLALSMLAACSPFAVKPLRHYQPDAFGASMYTRHYLSTPAEACEAARRALLSQGYVVTEAKGDRVSARKLFQPDIQHHVQMEFQVTCAADGPNESIAFASATQDQYVTKNSSNSASLGVGILGSVSLPFEGGLDSMVKIASKTVTDDEVYDRLFALMSGYLVSVEREAGKPATAESIVPKHTGAPAGGAAAPASGAVNPTASPAAASAPTAGEGTPAAPAPAPEKLAPAVAPASSGESAAAPAAASDTHSAPAAEPPAASPAAAPTVQAPAPASTPAPSAPAAAPADAPVPAGPAARSTTADVAVQTTPGAYAAPSLADGAAPAPSVAVQTTPGVAPSAPAP